MQTKFNQFVPDLSAKTDTTPTAGSLNLVTSQGIFAEFSKILEAQSGLGLTLAQVTEDGQPVWRWCYNDGT